MHADSGTAAGLDRPRWTATQKAKERVADNSGQGQGRLEQGGPHPDRSTDQLVTDVGNIDIESRDMQVENEDGEASNPERNGGAKERVSFRTNMTTDEESSDRNSVVKTELELATVVECFHARKFSAKPDKRGALKVNCSGTAKKQKKPIKTGMQGAQKVLDKDKMEAMLQMTKTRPGELREVMTGQSDGAPKVEPQNPTGTRVEARQEK
jgi:hypothetical protein